MTEKEFFKKHGKYFHLRMMKYITNYNRVTKDNPLEEIKKTNSVIFLDFKEGTYSIRWNDLVKKADEDLEEFKRDNPYLEWEDNVKPLKIEK